MFKRLVMKDRSPTEELDYWKSVAERNQATIVSLLDDMQLVKEERDKLEARLKDLQGEAKIFLLAVSQSYPHLGYSINLVESRDRLKRKIFENAERNDYDW